MKIRTATLLATFTLLSLGGCLEAPEPVAEPVAEPPAPVEPEPEPEPPPEPEPEPEESPTTSTPGPIRWAGSKGNGWIMIRGLDDGTYENYYPSVVKDVQMALQDQGLYNGPISGMLDDMTVNALGEFQKATNLHVSGMPTPRTREALKNPPQADSQQNGDG